MAREQWIDPRRPRSTQALRGLTFTENHLDRCAEERTVEGLLDAVLADPRTQVITVRAGHVAVTGEGETVALHRRAPQPADQDRLVVFLGRRSVPAGNPADPATAETPKNSKNPEHPEVTQQGTRGEETAGPGSTAYAAVVGVVDPGEPEAAGDPSAGGDVEGVTWRSLRSVAAQLPPGEASLAATMAALANWHLTHPRCPRCGQPTQPAQAGWIRACSEDGSQHFPRTDPAVIMAVVDEQDRLLLARGAGFTTSGMSVLAGFVEPGESLAGAVAREVAEEVGVTVVDVDYLGDQPWPFPTGLMIGFTARAVGTELRLQEGEIEAARWFTREEFAAALAEGSLHISGRLSIARRLIEHWYGEPLDVPERSLRR